MKRESTYIIKTVIEDWVPPVVRDSRFFARMMGWAYNPSVFDWAEFRKEAHSARPEDYARVYALEERIHSESDCTDASVDFVIGSIVGKSVLDVGCGTGHLLRRIANSGIEADRLAGCDFQVSDELMQNPSCIEFQAASIEDLPYADQEFDTVISTHTIEHILDINAAMDELRRVAKRRVVIVVPREREGIFTFNIHLHFFPYRHSFLKHMLPLPEAYHCEVSSREIFYWEDVG